MVRAAKMTDADVVTGFCSNFLGEWNFEDDDHNVKHISLAAGDVGGAGYKINYMAKANFLAKVSTLRKVHGTIKEIAPKNAPYVDWVSVCVCCVCECMGL